MRDLVKERFFKFISKTVMRFDGYEDTPTHFVGSIAFFYQDILKEVCTENEIKVGKIIKGPVEELIRYHMEDLHRQSGNS